MKKRNVRLLAGVAALFAVALYAGTNSLSSISGGVVRTSHVNQFFTALAQDLVPRNSSGVPTNNGGSIGTSTYRWLKAFISSGSWKAGDLKLHHTFNGTVTCGQGWMLADGRVISSANYDTEQGAGSWTTYVGTSPLDGKFLPNFTGRYGVGAATTTQSGSIAITAVGNSSSQVNIAHTHTVNGHTHSVAAHNHQWLSVGTGLYASNGTQSDSWSSGMSSSTLAPGADSLSMTRSGQTAFDRVLLTGSYYTSNTALTTGSTSPGTDSQLSSTQSIQPDSIQVQYCMRIID